MFQIPNFLPLTPAIHLGQSIYRNDSSTICNHHYLRCHHHKCGSTTTQHTFSYCKLCALWLRIVIQFQPIDTQGLLVRSQDGFYAIGLSELMATRELFHQDQQYTL